MFNEYTLRPDARGKLILNTCLQGGVYFVSALFIYTWLRLLEPSTLQLFGAYTYYILGFVTIASSWSMFRIYTTGIKFRMITTDTEIQFNRMGNSVSVKYADITRIDRTPNNILLIYTMSSDKRPVIAVSDTITDSNRFEETLTHFSAITDVSHVPNALRTLPRLLLTYAYMTGLFLNIISRNPNTVIGSGVVVFGLSIYSLVLMFRFREEIKSPGGTVILIILAILMLVRIYIAMQPGVFPNYAV